MADDTYNNMQQYQPPKAPRDGSPEEMKRLVAQLIEIFDDIYRRYGRLRFEDMGKVFQKRLEDDEGNIFEIQQSTEGLVLAINNNRVRFDESGMTIINAAGVEVFKQDNASGNLSITGIISALAGVIAGFTINTDGLTNGDKIQLMSDGRIRLGNLLLAGGDRPSITYLDPNGNVTWYAGDGVFSTNQTFSSNGPAYFIGKTTFDANSVYFNNLPFTSEAPNLYIDAYGQLWRTSGGGGGTGPSVNIPVIASPSALPVGDWIVIWHAVENAPSVVSKTILTRVNGLLVGSTDNPADNFHVQTETAGTYIFEIQIQTSDGSSYSGFSNVVTVSP